MSRRTRCPICREPWSNAAAHTETRELAAPGETVFWCQTAQRHYVLPARWSTELRLSVRSLLRALRALRGRA